MTELNDTYVLSWEELGPSAEGGGFAQIRTGERVVQVFGTFGGASALLEGSLNNQDWFTLSSPLGLPLSFTSAGGSAVLESPPYLRPRVVGGDETTSLTILVSIRKA